MGVVFVAQFAAGAGPGAWITLVSALACSAICVIAFFKGDRKFYKLDWIFLILAMLSLLSWVFAHQPLISVILITLTDCFGTLITIRKSYNKPFEESATVFALNTVKSIIALFAFESYSLVVWLFPAYLVLCNGSILSVIAIRRWWISKRN
jgi:hypothetical protein